MILAFCVLQSVLEHYQHVAKAHQGFQHHDGSSGLNQSVADLFAALAQVHQEQRVHSFYLWSDRNKVRVLVAEMSNSDQFSRLWKSSIEAES